MKRLFDNKQMISAQINDDNHTHKLPTSAWQNLQGAVAFKILPIETFRVICNVAV